MSEALLLDQAITAFNRETGLVLSKCWSNKRSPEDDDAAIQLHTHGIKYNVETKRWVQQASVGSLSAQYGRMPAPALLVADYVNPNMADRLRDAGLQFIDTAGNAFLNENNLFVFIKGNRAPTSQSSTRRTTRAFNASGLKLIFSFLLEPGLVGETYRTMAAVSGVSLGTIGWVLSDLQEKGYIQELGKKHIKSLATPIDLLDRWAEAYPEKLLPDLDLGLFKTQFQIPWKNIEPSVLEGCWGGEVGASLLDHYLSPEQGTLYLPKDRVKELVMNYRLQRVTKYTTATPETIRICEKFWNGFPEMSDNHSKHFDAAPDVLIYADLLASGEPRNLEAAERIYGQIKDRLQVD
ncbi:MAG: type IV toxin-antitoxin system AbiEi family antitoxin [Marinobacter sp.]|uniref:type IV toxin-antitoxin system AbiEi family antitoxin n=1 Tax=Marinobacter sp. TaxID=50741 RepID=UPI0034A0432F